MTVSSFELGRFMRYANARAAYPALAEFLIAREPWPDRIDLARPGGVSQSFIRAAEAVLAEYVIAEKSTGGGRSDIDSWLMARTIWRARLQADYGVHADAMVARSPWQKHSAHALVAVDHELAHEVAKAVLKHYDLARSAS